jgi:hypothetical protein
VKQPIPQVTRNDVECIVRRDFPADQFQDVIAILDEYGKAEWHRERERVRLAVLKLSGAKLNALRQNMEIAKSDYRDVLAIAEYPEYSKDIDSHKLPAKERELIFKRDWTQYETWLRAK